MTDQEADTTVHDEQPTDEQAKAEDERGEQTVTIEDVGPARKCVTIEIPHERIEGELKKNFDDLRSDAQLPGFRKGKAPDRLIEKRFGESIRDDVRSRLIAESYSQALEEEKLEVVGEPDVKDLEDIKLPDDGPMTFKVEIEVVPQIELPPLEGIAITRAPVEVTDEDVETQIKEYQSRFGKLDDLTGADDAAAEGDYVVSDFRILAGKDAADDAEVLASSSEAYTIVNGESLEFKGHIGGILVDDLGKQLLDKKVGDEVTISMTGPPTHEDEKIKDQPITLKLNITGLQRDAPASVEQVLEQVAIETEDELRTEVRRQLQARRQAEQEQSLHEQVSEHLLGKVELELPEGLTNRQTERLLTRRKTLLSMQGRNDQEVESQLAELRASSEDEARRELKLYFILSTAAKQLEIEVSESEANGRISYMAMQRNRRPEKLRQEMRQSGELESLYAQMQEYKTLEAIVEKAEITEQASED